MAKKMAKTMAKSRHLRYKMLLAIRKGMYSTQIARQLNLKRKRTEYHMKKLLDVGLIELEIYSSCKIYKLTEQGNIYIRDYKVATFSLPSTKKTRLHSLRINFPILKDNPDAKFERMNNRFNNWVPKYTTVKFPIGMTIQKNPKTITVMFHEFETEQKTCLTDFFSWILKGTQYVYYFLMNKMQIRIDVFAPEITHQHLGNPDPDLKGKVDDKKTAEIFLKRKAKGFFPADFMAKSWLDQSKGLPEIETNDFLYEERLLTMPETIDRMGREMVPMMQNFTEQINLHLEIQKETLKLLKKMNRGKK